MSVDVKPGDSGNEIKLNSNGHVPVAILGAPDFNVSDIRISSVVFGGAHAKVRPNGSPFAMIYDLNSDGRPDLELRFDTESLQLVSGTYYADVIGSTNDGRNFRGSDLVTVVGPDARPNNRNKLHPREGQAFVVENPSANYSLRVDSVWPNPAAHGAQLVFTLGSDEPAAVEMWSAGGRLMSRRDLGALGAGPHVVDLSEARALPNGVYFVRLSQGWTSARTKLIVQH